MNPSTVRNTPAVLRTNSSVTNWGNRYSRYSNAKDVRCDDEKRAKPVVERLDRFVSPLDPSPEAEVQVRYCAHGDPSEGREKHDQSGQHAFPGNQDSFDPMTLWSPSYLVPAPGVLLKSTLLP